MTVLATDWLQAPSTQRLFDLFEAEGLAIYAVGGCVRNTLLAVPVSDLDFATDADPQTTLELAKRAGLRAIPTGLDHGTVTLLLDDMSFEVTTFRDDVETDGRHAIVRFSKDLETDALRRDFTMNALYMDRHGQVIDVVGGRADIDARRVRFIGAPELRLKEDLLRALRYFRFFAWYGSPELGVDPDALSAIAAQLDGIAGLSRERVTTEMVKLLAAPDPSMALAAMGHVGLLHALFSGGFPDNVTRLVALEAHHNTKPDPLARLAALSLPSVETDLRLSRTSLKTVTTFYEALGLSHGPGALGYHHGSERALQILLLRAAIFETAVSPSARKEVQRGSQAVFPVAAADLMPRYTGPALGRVLKDLKNDWIASDFTLSRNALLTRTL